MPPIFYKSSAVELEFDSLSKYGYGALFFWQVTEREDDAHVLSLPHIWNENVVIVATRPRSLSRLLSDTKVHVLTGDPTAGAHLSSKGVLFSPSYVPGVHHQVVVKGGPFDRSNSSDQHLMEMMVSEQLMGVCSSDPESWARAFQQAMVNPLKGPSETGISLVTFDLDGVLVESKELHYDAFNLALSEAGPEYVMSKSEHDAKYCGLSTKQKLRMLTVDKGLPPERHEFVWTRKQYHTLELMKTSVKPDQRIISVIEKLRGAGYPVAVASNCIRDSVFYLLQGIGVHDLVTSYFSNEDVSAAKPDPEIYLAAAEHFGVRADEMVVVEDSNHGKQAALLAGALLCPVGCPADVTIDRLSNALATKLYSQPPLNILLPMAGSESMFINGSVVPKFLIDVNGESLLKRIVTNLQPNRPHRFIFVARQYQAKTYKLAEMCVKACDYNPTVLLTVKQKSGSALETCLVAREYINSGAPLLIANLNMWPVMMRDAINVDSLSRINADCVLTHFESSNEMFSYIKLNDRFDVTSISTKAKTSNLATTGYTLFKNGSTFISLCDAVLRARAQEIPPTSNVYLEDVANTALKKHMTVASVPVECIPIRNNDDIDKLRAALMD